MREQRRRTTTAAAGNHERAARGRIARALRRATLASLLLACAPAAHAASVAIVAPRRDVPVTSSGTSVIVGTLSGAARVDVAVRDLTARAWLRRDGTWGHRQRLDPTLLDGGGGHADWSLAFTPRSIGRHRLVVRALDADGNVLARHVQRFRAEAPSAPPPVEGGLGEFVALCPSSHRAQNDPIVFPGQPGQSHLHSFFGSTATDAYSTLGTLLGGGTTCDPAVDLSAYWVPTLLENGLPVEPEEAKVYYLTAHDDPGAVRPFPPGLRMLAGTPSRTGPDGPSRYKWSCRGADASSTDDFAVCPAGHELELLLDFPDCWNGRDLDAPDHKSHMAYGAGGACPGTHPVPVPRLQFKLRYPTSGGAGVRIATGSGIHASHGGSGYSAHGDFLNAWLPGTLEERVDRCLRRALKCGPDGLPS